MRAGTLVWFFSLLLLLSVPFWLVGALTGAMLPANLPVSGLMAVVPGTAAVLVVAGRSGFAGVRRLLARLGEPAPAPWWLPAVLVMPCATALACWFMVLAGRPPPMAGVSVTAIAVASVAFLVAAVGEELGWSGFLTEPLARRLGDRSAGIVLGLIWAVWHVVPLLQAGRPAPWIGWWTVVTVGQRMIMMWIYANAGRGVPIMVVFHASGNIAYALFPNGGTHYEPIFVAPIVVLVAVMTIACWPRRSEKIV